jgi:uncharacterized Zn-binding protein involved in type VI secretion
MVMQPLARVGDSFTNPGQPSGAIVGPGSATVFIGGKPALRVGDACSPDSGSTATRVSGGSATVFIGGKPAARNGDPTSAGGTLLVNQTNVLAG